jgi:hypothetical protein
MNMSYKICEIIKRTYPVIPDNIEELYYYDQETIEKFRTELVSRFSLPYDITIEEIYSLIPSESISSLGDCLNSTLYAIETSVERIFINVDKIKTPDRTVVNAMKMMGVVDYSLNDEKKFITEKIISQVDQHYEKRTRASPPIQNFQYGSETVIHEYRSVKTDYFMNKWVKSYIITYYINDVLYGFIMVMIDKNHDVDLYGNKYVVMRHISKTMPSYVVENVYGIKLPKLNSLLMPIVEQLALQNGATRIYVDPITSVQKKILLNYYGFKIIPRDQQETISNYLFGPYMNKVLYKDITSSDEDM